jgi:DNA polymerase III sliding clamp (beta) subunit (PCNA family)
MDFLTALNQLKPGLSNRDIMESGTCFNFHGNQIVTFNDVLSVSIPFETGIVGAVDADDLYKLLDRITTDEIEVTQTETELRIKAGKVKAGLSLKGQVLPPLFPEAEWAELPKQFKEAVSFCHFSVSKDMTRPHLTCIHLQGAKVCSSDNWRVTQFVMEDPIPHDFLLPGDAASVLIKYEVSHMSLDPSWAHFANEETGLIFSARRILSKFISVDSLLEIQGKSIKFPDLKETLERAKIMVEGVSDKDLKISITLADNVLTCRGEKGSGWVEESPEIDYQDKPITMLVNPIFLADILSRSQEVIVGEDVCLFQGPNFRHVMVLIRKKS